MTGGLHPEGRVGSEESLTALAYIVESYETPGPLRPPGAPPWLYNLHGQEGGTTANGTTRLFVWGFEEGGTVSS